MPAAPSLRIDRLLWFLRLTKTRSGAQALVDSGLVRMDGRRVERHAHPVGIGAVLTMALPGGVRVLRLIALPARRGPPAEAASCFEELTQQNESDSQQAANA